MNAAETTTRALARRPRPARTLAAVMLALVGCGAPSAQPEAPPVAPPAAPLAPVVPEVSAVRVPVPPLSAPTAPPSALVDLRTREGAASVGAAWRFSPARLVEVPFRGPGPDGRPTGARNATYEVTPRPGAPGFDDAGWAAVDPTDLETRRGSGRTSFAWYRVALTLPERVAGFDVRGATVVFEIVVDDYSEVWVDGALRAELGQVGRGVAGGFNAPNRVVLTRDARPGERHEVAVFAMNGPVSVGPENFIWVRSATLDFHRGPRRTEAVPLRVERRDPALDGVVDAAAVAERVATGFEFVEGPVWVDGGLTFSDPNANVIYRFLPDGDLSVFRVKSGYTGADVGDYHQPGSNGLAVDPAGRLTVCEHGNRRVTRLEPNGALTVVADRFEGERLNSPNDLVYRSDGTLYFTDPPFGLPATFDDPRKELAHQGVYRLGPDGLHLESTALAAPNGLAFSPDERWLYVDNWEEGRKVVLRFPVAADGALGEPTLFHDMTSVPGEIALDGLKVDAAGHVYVAGPGGVWVIAPDGRHLGTLALPELPANFAFGGADGRDLYVAARTSLYRIRVNVPGATFARPGAEVAP